MNKMAKVKWLLVFMLIVQPFFATVVSASGNITWGEVQKGVYDQLHPYTLNWSGDVLDKGGLNLSTMKVTKKSSEADIVINQYGSMGANGILQLDEDLQDSTDSDLYGFTNSVTIEKGGVYLIVLHDGTYAKLRIDRYLPESGLSFTKVYFSYVLEEEQVEEEDTGNYSDDTEWDLSQSLSNPFADAFEVEAYYEFEEGIITIPWEALEGDASWDIYRSDNLEPYVKMTDFRLTEPEYTDYYTFADHTYLYKVVVYNKAGEIVFITNPIMVSIVESTAAGSTEESVITLQINSTTATVNGETFTLEVAPFIFDGRTMVPLRFISEALGADIVWDGNTRSITLTLGSDKIVLTIDKSEAVVNGQIVMMDVPAMIFKGRTMVPIRFVSENFNQEIHFDNATKTITIKGAKSNSGSSSNSNNQSNQSSSKPANDSSYFIGNWSMWVPGTGVQLGDTTLFSAGADAGILSIYSDGSYTYPWNGKLVSGTWKPGESSDQIILLNYKFQSDWEVNRTDEGIRAYTYPGMIEDGIRAK